MNYHFINNIKSPRDIKGFKEEELNHVASELRDALLNRLSKKGGHIGPNLGMVEATLALHYVFDAPKDQIVFDVSHQCYTHKMLTGRLEAFLDEHHFNDISGYTNPQESVYDLFEVGHTSTSLSLASGLARARDLKEEHYNVIAVIGDGSLGGGEALEGLNTIAEFNSNFIILLNDNDMSIAENHGGLYKNLKELRETQGQSTHNIFKDLGLNYVFASRGNDAVYMAQIFKGVKDIQVPTVVHMVTQKGKGLASAEEHREMYHAGGPFNRETGEFLYKMSQGENYASITHDYLWKKVHEDKQVILVTSGTPSIYGYTAEERQSLGLQFIDVGIAEEQAMAMSSGLAKGGVKPVYAVYSTFIQRTFDQMSQDVCINKTSPTIIVGLASIDGMTDKNHTGYFDIPLIANIPNMTYLAPTNKDEYLAMLEWSINQNQGPVAIRMPVMAVEAAQYPVMTNFDESNIMQVCEAGHDIAIIGCGNFFKLGKDLYQSLKDKGYEPTLINPRFISGLDTHLLEELKKDHHLIITLEDGILEGGFGQKIASYYGHSTMKVLNYGIKKEFLDRYNPQEIKDLNKCNVSEILGDIEKFF